MGQDWNDMPSRDDTNKALDREFAVLCFDWDGTAVADRCADASAVRSRVERLCALGVDIAILSGAGVAEVDGQLRARPDVEGRLFLFLSSGSEMYVVGPNGPRLLVRRRASDVEDAQLTAVAAALRDWLGAAGLPVAIDDRLNLRRIDLVPGWPDPSVSCGIELRHFVDALLADIGIGGVDEVVDRARTLARDAGLAHPRVINDDRHIDIALTDEGDSMRHLLGALINGRGRGPQDVLVLGDQFGPDGAGDSLMLIPELRRSTFVSVGAELGGRRRACCTSAVDRTRSCASSTTSWPTAKK